MKKSIKLFIVELLAISLMTNSVCGLSVAAGGSVSNNSLNPYATSGTSTTSVSTAPSMLATYLATIPVNEHQTLLTTSLHNKPIVPSTVGQHKFTIAGIPVTSTHSTADSLQTPQLSNNSENQVLFNPTLIDPTTLSSSLETILEPHINTIVVEAQEHEFLGCGSNNREGIGIQKALDWLREKRMPDYGWENDTHMVILAKEVCLL